MHTPYSQLELDHRTLTFRNPNDWNEVSNGYPDIGDYCLVAYCSPKEDYSSWYSLAEYTKEGFKEWNTDKIISSHDVQAWKRIDYLPY